MVWLFWTNNIGKEENASDTAALNLYSAYRPHTKRFEWKYDFKIILKFGLVLTIY